MSIESRRPSADTNAKRVAPWLSRHERVPNVGLSLPVEELPNNAMEPSARRLARGRAAAHRRRWADDGGDLTRQHFGIITTIVGTILLAFSLRIKRQYTGEVAKAVDDTKRQNNLLEPTETYIARWLFWLGLTCVAMGSALQW